MQLTDSNFPVAWSLMLKRNNNPRLVFAHHMSAIFSLPKLQKESSEALRTMLSTVNVCLAAFKRVKALEGEAHHWLAYHAASRLPKETLNAWEHHQGSTATVPSYADLESFLNDRLVVMDAIENRSASNDLNPGPGSSDAMRRVRVHNVRDESGRPGLSSHHCNGGHILRRCSAFLAMDAWRRKEIVGRAKLCINCLSKAHALPRCTSNKGCQICGQRHHTLLHLPSATQPAIASQAPSAPTSSLQPRSSVANNGEQSQREVGSEYRCFTSSSPSNRVGNVLLATARITVQNPDNGLQAVITALIDQGSEATIVSEHVVQSLHLRRTMARTSIVGVGQGVGSRSKNMDNFKVLSTNNHFSLDVSSAYVLDTVTSLLPCSSFSPQRWTHIQGLPLADRAKRIDLILGVDLIAQIMLPGTRIGSPTEPIAQQTQLGWILSGQAAGATSSTQIRCHHVVSEAESLLKGFFEVETVPERTARTEEDRWCESFFQRTHSRRADGRYVVRLPFKRYLDHNIVLGRSHQGALNRFLQLERRLAARPVQERQYAEEIEEYFTLGQIAVAEGSESSLCVRTPTGMHHASCVLPHHAVYKAEGPATKQRIVFDASAKTSNGRSLNDVLVTGPPLQNDMSAVLLNWRKYRYVFAADIQKMYRCIDVHPEDTQYQRILWRAADETIKAYALSTLTFGTASAPYTAIRVIHQLAQDEKDSFPRAAEVLKEEIYVDDILSGGHTMDDAEEKRMQVVGAIKSARMELRKWSSNDPRLLASVPQEHRCCQTFLNWDTKDPVKALGMYWLPDSDCFRFKINFDFPECTTKRNLLAAIARLFDPLGLIAPVIIVGKLILKEVTSVKVASSEGVQVSLDWDSPVPAVILERWRAFRSDLPGIEDITVSRWTEYDPASVADVQLHAFCDGSSSSYAAAVYLRVEHVNGTVGTTLLAAKTKVTPVKPLTIPRTELSGAVLAVKLVRWLSTAVRIDGVPMETFFWTDATIVLHWLNGDVQRWKTFVANRVGFILDHSDPSQWRHVGTEDNPADCATRGLTPKELQNFTLWWRGPGWLSREREFWPKQFPSSILPSEPALEAKTDKLRIHHVSPVPSFVVRFSTYNRAVRVVAYLRRFVHNASHKPSRRAGALSLPELDDAMFCIVRMVQMESFAADLRSVRNSKPLPSQSKLLRLSPNLVDDILRVRGRLRFSALPADRRHPIILPSTHHFTDLVINFSHLATLHGGAQLTLAHTRQRFWIITGKRSVQRVIRKCVRCFRANPTISPQLMGDLPLHRVNPPQRPFVTTGVDYTGAIELKAARIRGSSTYKGYIAVFICLATKAVHLELVTGLTTEHFLLAFDRFTGRRGMVQHLYSDNGTNFVGADRQLKGLVKQFRDDYESLIAPKWAQLRVTWHFTPPQSPNFGGLWEANVKSVKHHLKRVIADRKLTYEEMSTVLISIEACLNSRPLCPLTADADDLDVLTPAHFLIGDSMLAPPEYRPASAKFREQFLLQQSMLRHFWDGWSRDWLSHLQQRPKWSQSSENLKLDELILVKDDRFPPSQWLLGRIVELHPGQDGLVRVVTLKTQQGQLKRSILGTAQDAQDA
ncbi:uncharacterized protein LOC122320066 [Drosophila ficusphila]|uniref:uncharacterized protein LOC122320066 n=1 Tax=Drosophila ficusphila TaxID=30025 RepID=UPI001C8ACC42|nr:uncharacterized protein LOC122320066 [Drosophila ficusphila]